MVHSTHNKSYFDIQLNSRPKTPNVASMYSQIVKEQGCIGRTWGMGEKGGGGAWLNIYSFLDIIIHVISNFKGGKNAAVWLVVVSHLLLVHGLILFFVLYLW